MYYEVTDQTLRHDRLLVLPRTKQTKLWLKFGSENPTLSGFYQDWIVMPVT